MSTISSAKHMAMSTQSALAMLQSGMKPENAASNKQAENASSPGHGPATVVNLSENAKVAIQRAKAGQEVADKLQNYLDISRGKQQPTKAKSAKVDDGMAAIAKNTARAIGKEPSAEPDRGAEIIAKYGHLGGAQEWARLARIDNIKLLQDGLAGFDIGRMESLSKRLSAGEAVRVSAKSDPSIDERFVESIQLMLGEKVVELEKAGQPEQAQALRDAVRNGTVKVQKAEDVAELGSYHAVEHFGDAGGWGGTGATFTTKPTGAVKEALESGRARAFGAADRGAFYISW